MKKPAKIICIVLASVLALSGAFFGGYALRGATYSDELKALNWYIEKIKSDYYKDVTSEEIIDAITYGIDEKLLDNYSTYYTAEEYELIKSASKGNKEGIGMTVVSDTLVISRINGNSPCENSGLKVGDKITAILAPDADWQNIANFTEFAAVFDPIENGVNFSLKVDRNGEEVICTLCRATYLEGVVFYGDNKSGYSFKSNSENGGDGLVWTENADLINIALPDGTAYIRLNGFSGIADTQFDEAMKTFKQSGNTNLILDLRSNGGGYMHILKNICAHLVVSENGSSIPIVNISYKGGKAEITKTDNCKYNEYNFNKIVVLANDGTASASECLIGAMLDYGTLSYDNLVITKNNCVAKTYGKGIMQTTWSGLSGDAVKLTVARVLWPISGTCIQDVGIFTTEENSIAPDATFKTDNELTRAIEIISRQ